MDRKDFIDAIFAFYNAKEEKRVAYDLILSKVRDIDFNKLYMLTMEENKTTYLPSPNFFAERLDRCHKININKSKHIGNNIRVIFKSGRFTDFVICGYGLTLDDIKEKSPQNDNIQEVRMYPKEVEVEGKKVTVALIGNTVYPEQTRYEVVYARN